MTYLRESTANDPRMYDPDVLDGLPVDKPVKEDNLPGNSEIQPVEKRVHESSSPTLNMLGE